MATFQNANEGRWGGHLSHFVVFTVGTMLLSLGMVICFGLSLRFHWQEEQNGDSKARVKTTKSMLGDMA